MARKRRQRQQHSGQPLTNRNLTARLSVTGILLLGLIIGLAGALYYTWVVAPIVYVDAGPARFSEKYKSEYIFLVSQSYAADGDWEQARRRLDGLNDPALAETVSALLESYLREQRDPDAIRNLAQVAQKLGATSAAVALFAPTPLSGLPTETPTPTATAVLLPTATALPSPTATTPPTPFPTATATSQPSPTTRPTYRLLYQQRTCGEQATTSALLVVETVDALLEPLPGTAVEVSWPGGNDQFYTGFQPEAGAGYGDFTMEAGVSYSVLLPDGSPEISGLRAELCDDGALGGWQLTFQNLIVRQEPESEE